MQTQPPSNPDEILSFAIALERALRGLYASISQEVSEPDLKKVLRRLADDELGHEKLLLSNFASVGASSPDLPSTPFIRKTLFQIFQKARNTMRWASSPPEAIAFALAIEIRGEQLYSSWSQTVRQAHRPEPSRGKAPAENATRTLDFLASEERRHASILTIHFRALTGRDPQVSPDFLNLIPWPEI